MTPELITAIAERIKQSHTKEAIRAAVLEMGHDEQLFEEAYAAALQSTKETIIVQSEQVTSPLPVKLPGVGTLFKNALTFTTNHLNLVALLIIPSAFIVGASTVIERYETNVPITAAAAIVILAALVVYCLHVAAVVFSIGNDGAPSYREAMMFAYRNVISLFIISFLVSLVWWGGFLLFIIPGVIAGVYVYFAQFALIHEGKKGMNALLASRAAIRGRWGLVAGTLIGFSCLTFLPVFVIGSIGTAFAEANEVSDALTVFGSVVFESLLVFATIMSLHASNHLYKTLRHLQTPLPTPERLVPFRYWFLVLSGLAITAFVVIAILVVEKNASALPGDLPLLNDSAALHSEIIKSQELAMSFFATNNQSFEGVCSVLIPNITVVSDVVCNDAPEGWAIAASSETDTWCSDKTTYAKIIKQPLGERLECIGILQ